MTRLRDLVPVDCVTVAVVAVEKISLSWPGVQTVGRMDHVNTVTVRRRRVPKRPTLSGSATASLQRAAQKKIFFSDNLRQRWEQIVSKGRL